MDKDFPHTLVKRHIERGMNVISESNTKFALNGVKMLQIAINDLVVLKDFNKFQLIISIISFILMTCTDILISIDRV